MTTPLLTAVILTRERFATIRRTVGYIAAQDMAHAIELLIVAPDRSTLGVEADAVSALHSVTIVEADTAAHGGTARAAAVMAAAAPVVVFAEDHSFPRPGWAAALLEAHRDPWVAVGPVVHNANPETTVSWADLLMGYGPWLAPGASGERDHLPGHNSSYKVSALRHLGAELPSLMEAETPLQWRLRAGGERLFLEARAAVAHTNFDRWGSWLQVAFHMGRVFAATRALDWSPARRTMFTIASPLVPLVRLQRHLRQGLAAGMPVSTLLKIAPTLAVGLVVDGVGQAVGMLAGAGRSARALAGWEFERNVRRPRQAATTGARSET